MTIKAFTVPIGGIGKPDYSKEISLGRTRPGLTLKFNQGLKIFGRVFTAIPSPYSNVTSPLAPGETVHFIDSETGLELPFLVLAGYTLSSVSAGSTFNRDAMMWGYFEGYLRTSLGIPAGGTILYESEVVALGTTILDPGGVSAHLVDFQITNKGSGNLEGGIAIYGILEAVGTPPLPTTKVVRCKFCGHEETVPQETTNWICPECDKLNIYYSLANFRGSV